MAIDLLTMVGVAALEATADWTTLCTQLDPWLVGRYVMAGLGVAGALPAFWIAPCKWQQRGNGVWPRAC